MGCPINDVRDFKSARNNGDNVAKFERREPTSIHHARVDEAEVEVSIEAVSETVTCEEVTMTTANNNNAETLRTSLNDLNETIENVLNNNNNNNETTTEEADMTNSAEQTTTVSITDVTTRYKTLRRNRVLTSVLSNASVVAGITAGAALNGRDVKRAAVTSTIISTVCVAIDTFSGRKKALDSSVANHCNEEDYQEVATFNKKDTAKTALWNIATGLVIGAFAVKKAVEAATEE